MSTDLQGTPVADRAKGAFLGLLVADALCLGSHYEYDAQVIKDAYAGKALTRYMGPGEQMGGSTHGVGWGRRNYHPGQKAGDQTDYGEYNLLMLEYFASTSSYSENSENPNKKVDMASLLAHWKARITGQSKPWGAWLCTQTKQTFQMVQEGTPFAQLGGMSNAMALRSGPVFGVFGDEDAAVGAGRQLMFTHRNEEALAGSDFFTRVTFRIIHKGVTPTQAMREVCDSPKTSAFEKQQCQKGFAKFAEVADASKPLGREEFVDDLAMTSMARLWDVGKTEPIKVGKASPTEGTMPSSIYMILKYEQDLIGAAQANAMVGGDNASRAVAIGMVLGAYHGAAKGIPEAWRKGLNAWNEANALLDKLPLIREASSGKQEL